MTTDLILKSIVLILGTNRKGRDVKVNLDKVPSGIWLWEERTKSHVRVELSEIVEILGPQDDFFQYLESLPVFYTSWKFINPHRLNRTG